MLQPTSIPLYKIASQYAIRSVPSLSFPRVAAARGIPDPGSAQKIGILSKMRTSQTPLLGSAALCLVARGSHARENDTQGEVPVELDQTL